MKCKTLVMFSSFLVLVIGIVCVSVYAYNAYCTANADTCRATASINNYALFDGSYSLYARVDSESDADHDDFADNRVSTSVVVDREDGSCSSGSAYASVSGFDAQGRPHHKSDSASF